MNFYFAFLPFCFVYYFFVLRFVKNLKINDMKDEFKNAIEEYQCPGCISGYDIECFEHNTDGGIGCGRHMAGTGISSIGKIFLGMPKGFDRLGECTRLKPYIFETFESSEWKYDMWNIPVWKYKNEQGHTLVRGIMPRRNEPFIHIFLEDCISKINCLEIIQDDVNGMD